MKIDVECGCESIEVSLDKTIRKVYLLVDGGMYEPMIGTHLTKGETLKLANELLFLAERMEDE